MRGVVCVVLLAAMSMAGGCRSNKAEPEAGIAERLPRQGTEIVVCGQLYDIGTPVVLWTDPGGYDAYRTERRFAPWQEAAWEPTTRMATTQPDRAPTNPARLGLRYLDHNRQPLLSDAELDRVRGGGWDLPTLQRIVDQFVIHYDVCGTSQRCFFVLHDLRGLSVQFMLDIDGTIYQTMDLKERAWHAGIANTRSIGIEIANMGAYATSASLAPLEEWYEKDADGQVYITIPDRFGDGGVRVPGTYRPARNELIVGEINGTRYRQYDLTPQQYAALIRLTAALSTLFPRIDLDYPRASDGTVLNRALTREEFDAYQGVLAHWHVTEQKQDPGPAFQWDHVIENAKKLVPKTSVAEK
jgi:N-acetyl-anhydromuramyl-L-alanine amidase AmpD